MIQILCQHCGCVVEADDSAERKKSSCPHCNAMVQFCDESEDGRDRVRPDVPPAPVKKAARTDQEDDVEVAFARPMDETDILPAQEASNTQQVDPSPSQPSPPKRSAPGRSAAKPVILLAAVAIVAVIAMLAWIFTRSG